MEKILTIDGRQVKFKSTGAFLLRYKAQFKRDAIKDIIKLQDAFDEATKKVTNAEAFDLDVFYNLVWTLAKTADSSIEPPLDWYDTFDDFPLMDVLPEVIEMISSSFTASVKKK